jgi:hypothetical protein
VSYYWDPQYAVLLLLLLQEHYDSVIWFYCEVINICNKQYGLLCGNFNNLFKDRKSFTCQSEGTFNCSLFSAQALLENFVFVLQCPSGIRSHEVVMRRNVPSATVIATVLTKEILFNSKQGIPVV